MPDRYVNRTNHSTLSLNDAKMRMTKNMKAKYRGADATAPQSVANARDAYDGIVGKMSEVISALSEIDAQLTLSGRQNAPWASKAVDRYISATTTTKTKVNHLNSFVENNKASLSNMSSAQRDDVAEMNEHVQSIFLNIVKIVKSLSQSKRRAIKGVFTLFVDDLVKMDGHISSVLATPAVLTGTEILDDRDGTLNGGYSRDRIGSNPNTWSPQTYGHYNRIVGGGVVGLPNSPDFIHTRFL